MAADSVGALAAESGSISSVDDAETSVGPVELPHRHRVPVDDERPAVDGVDRRVGVDLQAGRVGDPLDAVVDDGDGAARAVVDEDHALRLVDVVVGAGIGDADARP